MLSAAQHIHHVCARPGFGRMLASALQHMMSTIMRKAFGGKQLIQSRCLSDWPLEGCPQTCKVLSAGKEHQSRLQAIVLSEEKLIGEPAQHIVVHSCRWQNPAYAASCHPSLGSAKLGGHLKSWPKSSSAAHAHWFRPRRSA